MVKKINNSYIIYSEDGGEVIVHKLFVSQEERGEKLGYKLLDYAKKYAIKKKEHWIIR